MKVSEEPPDGGVLAEEDPPPESAVDVVDPAVDDPAEEEPESEGVVEVEELEELLPNGKPPRPPPQPACAAVEKQKPKIAPTVATSFRVFICTILKIIEGKITNISKLCHGDTTGKQSHVLSSPVFKKKA